MSYDNTNKGVLFKNEKKEAESHADYRGNINVNGQEFWLNCWVRESKKDGKKFMSLTVKPKEAREEKPKTLAQQRPQDFDDDKLPF